MFTVVAFDDARAAAQAVLLALAGAVDQHVTVIGNDITVPDLNKLVGVQFIHGTQALPGALTLAQLRTPSMLALLLKDIDKSWDSNGILDSENIELFLDDPLELKVGEQLEAWMANGAVVAARGIAAVLLADGPLAPVKGDIRTVRCTSVTPVVADVWTLGVLNPQQQLPVGKYQVVGMSCVSPAEAGWARLIFTGSSWRPGCPIRTDVNNPEIPEFRNGKMGVWGEFNSNTIPRLEVLSIAAVANPDVYLDLIKTG